MLLDRHLAALVLVDYQTRLMPVIPDADQVVRHALFLAQVARALGVPVIGTEQNPLALGANDPRVAALCDDTLSKMHFSAVSDGLLEVVRARRPQARQLVMAGCEAHVCLMQTALEAQAAGLQVVVVAEACGSRRAEDKALALQRMASVGIVVASADMVAFEWLRTCEDPAFREVLALIKARPTQAHP
jgi:nicotinamidase-related amidase